MPIQFLRKVPNFNFIGRRNIFVGISLVLMLITIVALVLRRGPNWSIDFVGGTVVQLKFQNSVEKDMGTIRGIVGKLDVGSPEVKSVGGPSDNEIQIIVKKKSQEGLVGDEIKRAIAGQYSSNPFEVLSVEQVGQKVGGEFRTKAILGVFLSLVAIILYMAARFAFPFGVGGVLALFHDVTIVLGAFVILKLEISLPIIAAFLTIIGYSINDTIVVFDRARENMRSSTYSKHSLEDLLNVSVNQTLSRSIITSMTVLFVVVVTYITFYYNADVVRDFAFAMIVGTISGSYSTIFIASPIVIYWHKRWPVTKI
jgi:preprotein translocase subunit SecF